MDATTSVISAQSPALYSQRDVTALCSFSRSQLYKLVAGHRFPVPAVVLGPRFTRWKASDVQAWLADPQGWITAHVESVVTA